MRTHRLHELPLDFPEPVLGPAWTREEFEQKLREKEKFYHINHEFHILGWVANRFYYQIIIPMKDAAIMANCPHREIRRSWLQRIIDHDGTKGDEGGIEEWLRLAEAVGLTRELRTACLTR